MFIDRFEHFLYRIYEGAGTLLYVGITYDLKKRMYQHSRRSAWWVEHTHVSIDKHPSRTTALEAEIQAIKSERPKYNKFGLIPRERRDPFVKV